MARNRQDTVGRPIRTGIEGAVMEPRWGTMFERFKHYHIAVPLQSACGILIIRWHAGKADNARCFALQLAWQSVMVTVATMRIKQRVRPLGRESDGENQHSSEGVCGSGL